MGRAVATEAVTPVRRGRSAERIVAESLSWSPLEPEQLIEFMLAERCPRKLTGSYTVIGGEVRAPEHGNMLTEFYPAFSLAEFRDELSQDREDGLRACFGDAYEQLALACALIGYEEKARRRTLLHEADWAPSQTDEAYFLLKGNRPIAALLVSDEAEAEECECSGRCRCQSLDGYEHLGVQLIESQSQKRGAAEALVRMVARERFAGLPLVFDAWNAKAAAAYTRWGLDRLGDGYEHGRFVMRERKLR